MTRAAAPRRVLSLLPLAVAATLALAVCAQALWAVRRFRDVFPFGDMVDLVWRYLTGPAGQFWIFQDNEHLPLFVMPIYWIDLRLFAAQGGVLTLGTVALAIGIALAPVPALRRALPGRPLLLASTTCCAVAMQLWLGDYVNLLWTKQIHMYVALFAVTMALACVCPPGPPRWHRVAGACAWAAAATFSFGYGMVCFPVVLVIGIWRKWPWRRLACIVLTGAACVGLYLALSIHVLSTRVFWSPSIVGTSYQARYALAFIASPVYNSLKPFLPDALAFDISDGLTAVGAAWFAWRCWRWRHRPPTELAAWSAGLVLFTAITAGQTALARSMMGVVHAADARYIVGQIPFWAGLLLAGAEDTARRGTLPAEAAAGAILSCAMALLLASQQATFPAMHEQSYERWSSAMSAIDGVHDPAVDMRNEYVHSERVPAMISGLRALGRSVFAWRQAKWLGRTVDSFGASRGGCLGAFDTLVPVGNGAGFRAEGWAADTPRVARSPWVLLADQAGTVRGIAHGGGPRGDVTASLHRTAELYAGWTGYLPAGVSRTGLNAWLLVGGKHPCRLGPLPAQG